MWRWLIPLVAAGLVSCTIDLDLKRGARISCTSNEDCPSPWGCGPSGYCEAPGAGRPSAPTPTVAPDIGTVGTRFEITVLSEGELAGPPDVELLTDPITSVSCEDGGDHWVCPYVADGTELGDQLLGRLAFDVVLIGSDGGITAFEPAGFIELDFLAPAVVDDTTEIRVVPGEENVREEPDDLGPESTLQVSFTLNKVLTESLSDTLGDCTAAGACLNVWLAGTTDVFLTDAGTAGRYILYEEDNPAGALLAEGVYTIRAEARDYVGNAMDPVDVGTITVDNTPPDDLTSAQLDALVVHRTPWGSRAAADPQLTIGPVPATTLPSGYGMILWRGTSQSPVERIGVLEGESDGSAPELIFEGDLPRVYASPVDAAGNVSTLSPQLLPNMIWTASLKGKVFASDAENPHRLVATTNPSQRFPPGIQAIHATDGVDQVGGLAVSTTVQPDPWERQLLGSFGPSARDRAGMAFDRAMGRVIVFGGATSAEACRSHPPLLNDTWEFTNARWRELDPIVAPSPRAAAGMIATDHMGLVLFGGCTESGQSGQTFHFDGTDWHLMSDTGPSARYSMAMAYDTSRGRVVLFGGESFEEPGVVTVYGDTWEWDGAEWTSHPVTPAPSPRTKAAMAFDPLSGETVMFGGMSDVSDASSFLDETWSWNGARWLLATPAASPPPSAYGRMVFDDRRSQVVLYGGLEQVIPPTIVDRVPIGNALWSFDGTTWSEVATWTGANLDGPVGRHSHGMVYDPRGELIVGCGSSGVINFSPTYSDWWTFDQGWANPPGLIAPVLTEPVVAMDPTTSRPLLLGTSGVGANWITETYYFLGGGWLRFGHQPADPEPPHSTMVAIAANPLTEHVLVAGGYHPGGPTDMGTWQRQHPSAWYNPVIPGGDPATRRWASMVYDDNRERILMFGGWHEPTSTYLDELWVRETNDPGNVGDDTWVQEPSSGPLSACDGWPAGRYRARMVFDPVRQVVVLPGGHPGDSQVWELDDTCWHAITPAWDPAPPSPPTNFITEYGVAFDPGLGEVLVFHYDEVWSWNGTRYRLLNDEAPGAQRPATVHVPELGATFYYGGGSTWLWRSDATATPTHVFHLRTPDTGTAALPSLTSVELSWFAGASAESGTTPGVFLTVWEAGRWRPVGVQNDSDESSTSLLRWSSDTEWAVLNPAEQSARLRRMVALREPVLSFAAFPLESATVTTPTATIATDYVEVTIAYRLD